jgi:hypothetical protein
MERKLAYKRWWRAQASLLRSWEQWYSEHTDHAKQSGKETKVRLVLGSSIEVFAGIDALVPYSDDSDTGEIQLVPYKEDGDV